MLCFKRLCRATSHIAIVAALLVIPIASVSAQDNPVLDVNPRYLSFCIATDGTIPPQCPAVRHVMVSNIGYGDMTWSGSADQAWVVIDPALGGNFDSVAVSIDYTEMPIIPDTLFPGDTVVFSSVITFTSSEAENSPQTVDVDLLIFSQSGSGDEYDVRSAPSYFDITIDAGGPISYYTAVIYEISGAELPFMAFTLHESNWLSIQYPFSGFATPDSLTFMVNPQSLALGFYADTIVVYDPFDDLPWFNDVAIPVYMTVTAGGGYVVRSTPPYFDITTIESGPALTCSAYIYEIGGVALPFETMVLGESDWLTLADDSLPQQTTPSSLNFSINIPMLTVGTYVDTIVVYDSFQDTGSFAAVAIPVVVTVYEDSLPSMLLVYPASFEFHLAPGEIEVRNMIVMAVDSQMIGFGYSHSQPWLAVNPYGMPPYVTPMTMPVGVNSDSLPPGLYVDTIFVYITDPTFAYVPPVTVPVLLYVSGDWSAGDVNGDKIINTGDAVCLIAYIFRHGPPPDFAEAADVNCNGGIDVGDAIVIINYVFRQTPISPCP